MIINTNTIIENLISQTFALDKYKKIIESVKQVNVSTDMEFQKTFNHFYKVRRNEQWRKAYYDLFEECKNNSDLKFEDIITNLYKNTNQIEASFSSKLLATINPNMPIWDQYVLLNLNLQLIGKTKDERLINAISLYSDIIKWYKDFRQRIMQKNV